MEMHSGQGIAWDALPKAELLAEIDLGNWGGAELFVQDVNGDGRPELLWLQSKGIFKSQFYLDRARFGDRYRFPGNENLDLFCLTVTDVDGRVLWQYGTADERPYCSHAAERTVCCHDVDGDGAVEVMALARHDLLILDGGSGRLKASRRLPEDNYAVLACLRNSPRPGDVTLLASVMDGGYPPHAYGNPTLFLNARLETFRRDDHVGSGHRITVLDADGDGCDEALIGYQLVKPGGQIVWTLDCWEGRPIDSAAQHVDHAELCEYRGDTFFALAGSDSLYWITSRGETVWRHALPHPQCCLVGRFRPGDDRPGVFLTNARESMDGFDVDGNRIWHGLLPEHWPMGRPTNLGRHILHKGVPAALWRSPSPERPDTVIYCEGGWPYGIDGEGRPALVFPHTDRAKKDSVPLPDHRADDFGMSYDVVVHDYDGDGVEETLIHDRRYAWLYRV